MPLGLQVIGRPGHEDDVFALAAVLEPALRSMSAS
jgi:Asp-tRNA(Asn)/Glu-tRNA(Gln) amidotransferase A subunit family amidase